MLSRVPARRGGLLRFIRKRPVVLLIAAERDPGDGPVVHRFDTQHVLLIGEGDVDFACGHCGVVLAVAHTPESLEPLVLQCPACCWFNRTR